MDTGSLTDALEETLRLFDGSGRPWTTAEVADRLDLGRRGAYARLEQLVEQGRLETKKVGANARVWWRPTTPNPGTGSTSPVADSFADDVLDEADVAVFVLDEQLDVVRINATTERYFDLDRERVVGRNKRELLHEEIAPRIADADLFTERVSATYDDNTYTERFECRLRTDDEYDGRWLEHRSKPIESGRFGGGRVELYYDVTERKQSEHAHRAAREELESFVDAVEEYAIFSLDTDGNVQTWNAGAERIKGYTADEIRGEHFSTFYTEADREEGVPERNLAAARKDGTVEDEGWRLRADGSRFWADVTITAVRDDDGDLEGYVKVTRDTTEQKRADTERKLLYETTRSIAAADSFEQGLQATLAAICERTNWAYAEAWTPSDDGALRRADADYYDDESEEFVAFSETVTFERGEGLPGRVWASGEFEWATNLSEGSVEQYPRLDEALDAGFRSSLGVPIVADGEVVTVLTFLMRDVRETDRRLIEVISSVAVDLGILARRRQVEAEIERERDLVDRILRASPVGIMVLDDDGTHTRINERAHEILEVSADEADSYSPADREVYDSDGDRVPPEEHPAARVLATGEPVLDWECRVVTPDGSERWLTVNAEPILGPDGEVQRVVTTGQDITRLKEQTRRLERRRDELEAELDEVFDRITDGFYGLDSELRFTFVNEQCEDLLGIDGSAVAGCDIRTELPLSDPFEGALHRALHEQETVSIEEYDPPNDSWFEYRIHPSETGLSVYFRDITERKQRQRELEESERLYRTLVDNYPNGAVALVDEDLRYLAFGGTPVGELDLTWDDLEGERVPEVLPSTAADVFVPSYEAALDGETTSFVREMGGRTYRFHFTPVRDAAGDVFGAMGMAQDLTEEKERQRELEAQIRQQEVLTELSQRALESQDIDDLLRETTERLVETMDSSYCKVLELDSGGEELLLRHGVGWDEGLVGTATVSAVEDDSQAAYTLATRGPVVVEDLDTESRFSGPDLLTDHDVRSGMSVVIGPPTDPWGILGVHDVSPRTFSNHDATFVQAVANTLSYAITRHAAEQQLIRQREQLSVLNNINEVVQEITGAVIDHSTRGEIQQAVCDCLAASDSYRFAWIGEVDAETDQVVMRAEAGADGYLDDVSISVDPSDERSTGPTGRALNTGEIQTVQRVDSSDQHDPWRDAVDQHEFNASAAIPLVHEGTVYGVLNVYTEREGAFGEQERTVVGQLGEIVGHAIAAVERKQALVSDELVELGIRIEDLFGPVEAKGKIVIEHTVRTGDGGFLIYGTATEEAIDSIGPLVQDRPEWAEVTFYSDEDPQRFELIANESPILSTMASLGGYVDHATIEEGDLHMTVHLTPDVDIRDAVDRIREAYPQVEMLRRRQVSRSSDDFDRDLLSELTDRQRTALEAAYAAGFFEWPRDSSGEEVAASMNVSPPTFHQHLRKAERKVFESLFSTAGQRSG